MVKSTVSCGEELGSLALVKRLSWKRRRAGLDSLADFIKNLTVLLLPEL